MTLAAHISEDELLAAITDAATLYGWRWHHVRRSDRALQMGHPGFPDLTLAKNEVVLFWELKGNKGKLSPDQEDWLVELPNGTVVYPYMLDWAIEQLRLRGE